MIGPGEKAGRGVAIDPQGTLVGRDASCSLMLASPRVSRQHAIIGVHDGEYVVEDLTSTNGTLLNGEPLTGTRHLRDGDLLTFADVEVEFQLAGTQAKPPPRSQPPSDETWDPEQPTDPAGTRVQPGHGPSQSLRQELREAPGFSAPALLLAIVGSVVGTILTSAVGTDQWGTLAGAAVGPVVSTTFTTRRAGEKGRVRNASIAILSGIALLITITGVSLADAAAGKSVIPSPDERPRTFPVKPAEEPEPATKNTKNTKDLGIETEPSKSLDCGNIGVGTSTICSQPVTIKSTGTDRLHITRVDVTGQDREDFTAGEQCAGEWLGPTDTCEMTVRFEPSAAGSRQATLVIHQNLPSPDRGTRLRLSGTGDQTQASFSLEVDARDIPGTVISEPSGIQCPGQCRAEFGPGATVRLSVKLDQDGGSVTWDGCKPDKDTCTLEINEDRTVRVRLSA